MPEDRASDPRRVPAVAWKSAWPVGHPNHTEDATGTQQKLDAQNAPKPTPNWKSAWPVGHPNHTEEVK
jgi:hypothetical protein